MMCNLEERNTNCKEIDAVTSLRNCTDISRYMHHRYLTLISIVSVRNLAFSTAGFSRSVATSAATSGNVVVGKVRNYS